MPIRDIGFQHRGELLGCAADDFTAIGREGCTIRMLDADDSNARLVTPGTHCYHRPTSRNQPIPQK